MRIPLWSGYLTTWRMLVCVFSPCYNGKLTGALMQTSTSQSIPRRGAGVPEPDAAQVANFVDMGFTEAQATKALRETVRFVAYNLGMCKRSNEFQSVRKLGARY